MNKMKVLTAKRRFLVCILLIVFYALFALHAYSQVTKEKIISNASELIQRDLNKISIVKYEPVINDMISSQIDSAKTGTILQTIGAEIPQPQYGFVTSDFVKVFPEAVNKDDNGEQNIDYYKLIPIMFKIIQDQNLRIKTLESKLLELQK